jgi:hypothetical protein|eukprot:COSAG01_NODE_1991_length_8696_cov_971.862743_2_plen_40_part_00
MPRTAGTACVVCIAMMRCLPCVAVHTSVPHVRAGLRAPR